MRSLIATLLPWGGRHRANVSLGDANRVLKDTLLRFSQLCTNARLALTLHFRCNQEEQPLVDDRAHFCDVSIRKEKPRTCGIPGQNRPLPRGYTAIHCGPRSEKWEVVCRAPNILPWHWVCLPKKGNVFIATNSESIHSSVQIPALMNLHIPRLTDFPMPVSVDGCLHFPLSVPAEFWRRGLGTSRY